VNPLPPVQAALAAQLLDALPQTQCTRCGYPDCAAYAHAMASGEAGINQCPPGGAQGVLRLAAITGQPAPALDPTFGQEGPRSVVYIDEAWCIGCTLCIGACPTDAIVGSNKRMHTVMEDLCTGCELCLPVCPVDCIVVENASGTATGWAAWSDGQAQQARERYANRQTRLEQHAEAHARQQIEKAQTKLADLPAHSQHTDPAVLDQKRATIEAALARARAKAGAHSKS
jgi:Na+-translocating ferredoxin:NAD+ oxidoreductase subunit B